jgi:hypothetical protein
MLRYIGLEDTRVIDSSLNKERVKVILLKYFDVKNNVNNGLKVKNYFSIFPKAAFTYWTISHLEFKNNQIKIKTWLKAHYLLIVLAIAIWPLFMTQSVASAIMGIAFYLSFRFSLILRRQDIIKIIKKNSS